MEPRLVVFDFDGTLMDSQHLIIEAMRRAFDAGGHPVPCDDTVRGVIGLSLDHAMAKLAPQLSHQARLALSGSYRSAYHDLRVNAEQGERLFPGARALIEALKSQPDTVLGIATGKSQRGLYGALERENLGHCFVTLQTADDAPSKPHPAMLEQAMRETGIAAKQTVMIGDAVFDMAMARNADVSAIGVSWGYHDVRDLRAAGAHHIAEDMTELQVVIDTALPGAHSLAAKTT